jgi:hypothetical protein
MDTTLGYTPPFTARDVAAELDRIAPRADGRRYNPTYVARIRNGYQTSASLEPLLAQAEANLANLKPK